MMDIWFLIDGEDVHSDEVLDVPQRPMLERVATHLKESLDGVEDPIASTGPTIVVRGNSIDSLEIEIDGSEAVVEEVRRRLHHEYDETTLE